VLAPPLSPDKRKSTSGQLFGKDLTVLLADLAVNIPPILEKLANFISSAEVIDTVGLFRIAGPTGKVQSLREELDQGTVNPSFTLSGD